MSIDHLLAQKPTIRLFGSVNESMLTEFFRQQAEADPSQPVVIELSTSGGNADIGRRINQELTTWQQQGGREIHFLGKTYVYSAGVTIMASIPPQCRHLTADCELLIHERKMKKTLVLDGALRGCRTLVHDALAEIDSGQRLEQAGFAQLVAGTSLTLEDVLARVLERDWYLTADEAWRLGLVGQVIR